MGQCYVRLKSSVKRRFGRGGRQYRHKRFDYAPQRSWRYNDAQVLNQISLRGTEYNSPVWELEERGEGSERREGGGSGGERVLLNPTIDEDSEGEEEGAGEFRSGGRLVFAESEDLEDTPITTPTDTSSGPRDRSASNSSQKIGRFEVFEVGGGGEDREDSDVVDVDITSTRDTTQLLGNKLS